MNTLRTTTLVVLAVCCCAPVFSQNVIAYQGGQAYVTNRNTAPAPADADTPYRFHKKLPSLYEGYAIEVAASNYPLDRTDQVFRRFGGIHYDKLEEGGYSYLILGRFSDEESALHFFQTIIQPQAAEARLVRYKEGKRQVVREES